MTEQEGARLRALVAQLKWETVAARSAAEFARLYAKQCCRHTEAVSECPHCNIAFLASYASRSADVFAATELDALLSAPVISGWQPIDNGNTFVFCDYVQVRHTTNRSRGCIRGAGHNGAHVVQQLDDTVRAPVLFTLPDETAAPVVTQEGESKLVAALRALLAEFRSPENRDWLTSACADRLEAVLIEHAPEGK
jgi:hypothetical protein